MRTRGIVYLVQAQRRDGGWIRYRTCDRVEAQLMARQLNTSILTATAA